MATEKYDDQSAYWIFKLAGVLVDAHYHDLHALLNDVQKETMIKLGHHLIKTDQAVADTPTAQLSAMLTKANEAAAKIALTAMQDLSADLITKSTDFSPLNYDTDLNL